MFSAIHKETIIEIDDSYKLNIDLKNSEIKQLYANETKTQLQTSQPPAARPPSSSSSSSTKEKFLNDCITMNLPNNQNDKCDVDLLKINNQINQNKMEECNDIDNRLQQETLTTTTTSKSFPHSNNNNNNNNLSSMAYTSNNDYRYGWQRRKSPNITPASTVLNSPDISEIHYQNIYHHNPPLKIKVGRSPVNSHYNSRDLINSAETTSQSSSYQQHQQQQQPSASKTTSSAKSVAVCSDGEIVIFDDIDQNWNQNNYEYDHYEYDNDNDDDFTKNVADAAAGGGAASSTFDNTLCNSPTDVLKVTKMIGILPITEYEGSPRRFGSYSQKNSQSEQQQQQQHRQQYRQLPSSRNLLKSPTSSSSPIGINPLTTNSFVSTKPGYPQRVINNMPDASTSTRKSTAGITESTCTSTNLNNPSSIASATEQQLTATTKTTLDYLYEFSETRKVLEDFFKSPNSIIDEDRDCVDEMKCIDMDKDKDNVGGDDEMESVDDSQEYENKSENAAYIGERLAKLSNDNIYYDRRSSPSPGEQSNFDSQQISNEYYNNNNIELYLDSNSRNSSNDIVNTIELDQHHHHHQNHHHHSNHNRHDHNQNRHNQHHNYNNHQSHHNHNHSSRQNVTLSPETTDYDSNCGDLDSLSNEINGIGINSTLNVTGIDGCCDASSLDYGHLYTSSMPVLEDGLSSGHASDSENNISNSAIINNKNNNTNNSCNHINNNNNNNNDNIINTNFNNTFNKFDEEIIGNDPKLLPPPPSQSQSQSTINNHLQSTTDSIINKMNDDFSMSMNLPNTTALSMSAKAQSLPPTTGGHDAGVHESDAIIGCTDNNNIMMNESIVLTGSNSSSKLKKVPSTHKSYMIYTCLDVHPLTTTTIPVTTTTTTTASIVCDNCEQMNMDGNSAVVKDATTHHDVNVGDDADQSMTIEQRTMNDEAIKSSQSCIDVDDTEEIDDGDGDVVDGDDDGDDDDDDDDPNGILPTITELTTSNHDDDHHHHHHHQQHDESQTSIWIPRCESTSQDSYNSDNPLKQSVHVDDEEADTDLETDRLLGQQRLDVKMQYDDKKWADRRNLMKKSAAAAAAGGAGATTGIATPLSQTFSTSTIRQGIGTSLNAIHNENNINNNNNGGGAGSTFSDHKNNKLSVDHDGGHDTTNQLEIAIEKCYSSSSPSQSVSPQTEALKLKNTVNTSSNNTNNKESPNKEALWEPAVLIEGVLFRAKYLGSTQLVCEGQPTKSTRMMQAEEAVSRIKAPEGENQPSTEVDLFISTQKIMVLNTNIKQIMMDHALRTISYIADIGDLVVLMARRRFVHSPESDSDVPIKPINRTPKMVCHIFESDEAQFIAQSIGQAFQVAYMDFLKANGIEDHSFVKEMDYQEVLNSQEIFGDELEIFAKKELQKEVVVPKGKGEILGVVIVESGWGSMLPTVVIANLLSTGAAARCGQLNIGDQIIAINGLSLVGLPLTMCQTYIRNTKNQTAVKFTVVPCPPVVEVKIKRPNTKYQLGFSVQNGVICSLLRGGIAERGGVRVGHRIIEINNQSVVAVPHEKIVNLLATSVGEILMKTMPTSMFRLLTGQEIPLYI